MLRRLRPACCGLLLLLAPACHHDEIDAPTGSRGGDPGAALELSRTDATPGDTIAVRLGGMRPDLVAIRGELRFSTRHLRLIGQAASDGILVLNDAAIGRGTVSLLALAATGLTDRTLVLFLEVRARGYEEQLAVDLERAVSGDGGGLAPRRLRARYTGGFAPPAFQDLDPAAAWLLARRAPTGRIVAADAYGDVNLDGVINTVDAVLLARAAIGLSALPAVPGHVPFANGNLRPVNGGATAAGLPPCNTARTCRPGLTPANPAAPYGAIDILDVVAVATYAVGLTSPLVGLPVPAGYPASALGPAIVLDTTLHQTLVGLEATLAAGPAWAPSPALARLIVDSAAALGVTRVRLEAQASIEGGDGTPPGDWVNDNASPGVTRRAAFNWTWFDTKVQRYVLPLRAALAARGEHLEINVCFVGFRPTQAGVQQDPAEYAEFVQAVLDHLRQAFALDADLWEVRLEPDNGGVQLTPAQLGALVVAAGDRIRQAGYTTRFVVPSVKRGNSAAAWAAQVLQVPRVAGYVRDLSYHRYPAPADSALRSLAALARRYGLRTGMLEHIGSGADDLVDDLSLADNSAWQQYTLAWPLDTDDGAQLYLVDATAQTITPGARTMRLGQFFRYLRPGAVRLGATSAAGFADAIHARNPDGRRVLAINFHGTGYVTVRGLPAGTYDVSDVVTTGGSTPVSAAHALPALTVAAGQDLTITAPGNSATLTLVQR